MIDKLDARKTVVLYDVENIREDELLSNIISFINNDLLDHQMAYYSAAYSDWSNLKLKEKKKILQNSGVILQQVVSYGNCAHKNASDIALCVDAVEFLLLEDIENYIIVTGDGGFSSLVVKLKKHRKTTIVISGSKQFSVTLEKFADKFYIFDDNHFQSSKNNNTQYNRKTHLSVDNKEEYDYISQEAETRYFKTIWAISKNEQKLKAAIKAIFKNQAVIDEIIKNGLDYKIVVHILSKANHNKDLIEKAVTNSLEKKLLLHLLTLNDKKMIFHTKKIENYSDEVQEKLRQIEMERNKKIPELSKDYVLDSLKEQGIVVSRGKTSAKIVEHIVYNYKTIQKFKIDSIVNDITSKLKTRRIYVESILKLMFATKTNLNIADTTRYRLCMRIPRLIRGNSNIEDTIFIAKEIFYWEPDSMKKRARDEEKYIKYKEKKNG